MCWGGMEPVKETQSTATQRVSPPAWVESAGQENYNLARQILDKGFQPYTGERVAPLSSDEVAAGNLVRTTASNGNPYAGEAAATSRAYGSTPGFQFDFNSIVDPNGPLGPIQNYINPYLEAVLAPTLRNIGQQGAKQRQGIDASATMSGAFGDARHGVVESEQRKNEDTLVGDTTGRAWADAFEKALGLRTQDASRRFATQQAQAGEDKAALERMRTSGIDLTALDKYEVSRALGLASAQAGVGENERKVDQAKLDANYGEFQREQAFQPEMIKFLTQILSGTPTTKTTEGESTKTESAPNNSGWQAVGTIAQALLLSDRRAKENIVRIGRLDDGLFVYRFNYKGDAATQIGLMAQDIEKVTPDAVHEIDGVKYVDYAKATAHLVQGAQR